jgi:hypothetical protein
MRILCTQLSHNARRRILWNTSITILLATFVRASTTTTAVTVCSTTSWWAVRPITNLAPVAKVLTRRNKKNVIAELRVESVELRYGGNHAYGRIINYVLA